MLQAATKSLGNRMTKWSLSILMRIEAHSHWSVNTLWKPSWPILLWPARPSVDAQMSYSPMASSGYLQLLIKEITSQQRKYTGRLKSMESNPHHLERVGLSKRVWRSETIFPLSGHVRLPPGHLGFFMSLNWNARKSSILSSEVTDPNYWWNLYLLLKFLRST